MRVSCLCLVGVLLVVAVPSVRSADPPADKAEPPMSAARKALDETWDFAYQGRTLADVVADVAERAKVGITLDPNLFQFGIDPNQPSVNVTLRKTRLKDGLRTVLAPYNLKVGLVRDGLFISTEEGLIARQLRQPVSVDCDKTPFAAVVRQLVADTGTNVVVDPRLGEKANVPVSLKLEDVPIETAIRLLAEVADLRAVRMNNVLFVTTPERAEKLRPDADGPVPPSPASPIIPVPPGGGPPFGGAIPAGVRGVPISPRP